MGAPRFPAAGAVLDLVSPAAILGFFVAGGGAVALACCLLVQGIFVLLHASIVTRGAQNPVVQAITMCWDTASFAASGSV